MVMKKETSDPLKNRKNFKVGKTLSTQPGYSRSSKHTIYMADALWRQLKLISFNNDKSVSKILEKASEEYLENL
jgi:hypothetical protein